jgi:hypothetical protein
MQRVRMSIPFFKGFGWKATVVCIDAKHSDTVKDPYLLKGLPKEVAIHYIQALPKKCTSKFGLGSIALRSTWHYVKKVNQLLRAESYDLIYFSTTQFSICALGPYWKRKFKVPYVIDMQDPWHSDYYEDKPKSERPKKYWFSYHLSKYLEPFTMKKVDGLISVSQAYLDVLGERYANAKQVPQRVITFGAFEKDFEVAATFKNEIKPAFNKQREQIDLVYVGRGGADMQQATILLFTAFKQLLQNNFEQFKHYKFHFIGTSYAPNGRGIPSITPIATILGIGDYVKEQTDRVPFFEGIQTLKTADGLVILGSDDPAYTASKIYPYILAKKPLLAIFNPVSSAGQIITQLQAGQVADLTNEERALMTITDFLTNLNQGIAIPPTDWDAFEPYTAKEMTKRQCEVFDAVIQA